MDEKSVVSLEEAIKRLPDGDMVHTFRQAGGMMLGAEHGRTSLIISLANATEIQETGTLAQSLGHGLCIYDDGWLFIATKKD